MKNLAIATEELQLLIARYLKNAIQNDVCWSCVAELSGFSADTINVMEFFKVLFDAGYKGTLFPKLGDVAVFLGDEIFDTGIKQVMHAAIYVGEGKFLSSNWGPRTEPPDLYPPFPPGIYTEQDLKDINENLGEAHYLTGPCEQ